MMGQTMFAEVLRQTPRLCWLEWLARLQQSPLGFSLLCKDSVILPPAIAAA